MAYYQNIPAATTTSGSGAVEGEQEAHSRPEIVFMGLRGPSTRSSRTYEQSQDQEDSLNASATNPTPSPNRRIPRWLIIVVVVGCEVCVTASIAALAVALSRDFSGARSMTSVAVLNESLGEIRESLEKLKIADEQLRRKQESYHPTQKGADSCSSASRYNPYSDTCFELIKFHKNWTDAKEHCEAKGQFLATFETLESASWVTNIVKTNSVWNASRYIWIGGHKNTSGWYWMGRYTGLLNFDWWGVAEPNGNGMCLDIHKDENVDHKFDDEDCENSSHFICEA